jgi:hypothetical protein
MEQQGSRMTILEKVTALLGEGAVLGSGATTACPRVAPGSPDAVALLLGTAHQDGWRVRIEGAGTWLPSDAPADSRSPAPARPRAAMSLGLTATAEAGIGLDQLRQQLADAAPGRDRSPDCGRTLAPSSQRPRGAARHGFGRHGSSPGDVREVMAAWCRAAAESMKNVRL